MSDKKAIVGISRLQAGAVAVLVLAALGFALHLDQANRGLEQRVVSTQQQYDLVPKPGTVPDKEWASTVANLYSEKYVVAAAPQRIAADKWVQLIDKTAADMRARANQEQNVYLKPTAVAEANCGVGRLTGYGVYSPRGLGVNDDALVAAAWNRAAAAAEAQYNEAVAMLPNPVGFPSFRDMNRVVCPSP